MKMQLGKYRNNYDFIKAILLRDKDKPDLIKTLATISAAIGVPVVVVTHYAGEIIGFTPEINESIEKLKVFYGYESIEE